MNHTTPGDLIVQWRMQAQALREFRGTHDASLHNEIVLLEHHAQQLQDALLNDPARDPGRGGFTSPHVG